ncbi:MAG: TIGR02266 family protein [Desulfuromonadales bacterium]
MNLRVKLVDKQYADNSPVRSSREKKILLVDDIDFFIEAEKSALQCLDNFQILTAHSGNEALRIIQKERPDLVYLDLYMDNMDGDECCRIIKETYGSNVAVIMLTHGGSLDDFERCWDSGCDGIIVKPINPHLFAATTKKYLSMQSSAGKNSNIRHAARVKVKYEAGTQETLTDYSVNLSTGGLFLATADILPIDTKFLIEFTIPVRSKPVCCKARVAWVNDPQKLLKKDMPPGMGLQFVEISLSDIDAIREYLSGGRLLASW